VMRKVDGRLAFAVVAAVALGLLGSSLAFTPVASHSVLPAEHGAPSAAARPAAEAAKDLLASAKGTPLPPAGSGTWINVTKSGTNASPPAALWNSVAYDPADQEVVDFGGCTYWECSDNLTWVFSDGIWTNVTDPNASPPARIGASMDYDANMGGVLLFGGVGTLGYLNDTWLFSGGRWTNLSWLGPAPPARIFASMAFDPDPAENGSVLWGGYNVDIGYLNDTWIWESWSGWVFQNISGAPPVADATSMYYDPTDSAMVLYGAGFTSSTWELYADQWWQVNTPAPPYRSAAGMVYDPTDSALLLFGGVNGSVYLNDAWEFTGGTWSDITAALGTAPVAREFPGLTLDPTGTVPFLFGGTNATTDLNDSWALTTLPVSSIGATPSSTEVSVPVTFTATVGAGVAPYVATFSFGDNVSTQVTGDGPTLETTHAYINPGTYDASVNVTDSVGLTTSATMTPPVTVGAGPAISASANPSTVDVGQAVTFSATATSPGAAPITYAWAFGDGTEGTGASPTHSYATAGTFGVAVVGTDSDGVEANSSLFVLVVPQPTLSVGDNRSSATVYEPISFYANISGGTGPYRFAWNFGDGNSSTFPSPFHVFTTPGNYTVQVWTNDSFSVMDHQSITVPVHAAAGQTPPAQHETVVKNVTGGTPSWFYPALGALVAIAVVGAVVLLARRRRS